MNRSIFIAIASIVSLAYSLSADLTLAQGIPATITPVFNGAIINGPAAMIWERGKASGSGLICGRTYSNDLEKAELLSRQSQGLCGRNRNPQINTPTFKNKLLTRKSQKILGSIDVLSFNPSLKVRRNNFDRLVLQLRSSDPVTADRLERLFASTDVIGEFSTSMTSLGLQSNNVADAYAIYWTQVWMQLNDRGKNLPHSQLIAVRNQVANALLATPQFGSATDAQKQEIAEALLVQTILIAASIDNAKSDPTQTIAVKAAILKGAKGMGLDLERMTLTSEGFRYKK